MQRIFIIRPGNVVERLPAVMPWLLKAVEWTGGRRTLDGIVRAILNDENQLWIGTDLEGVVKGAIVTKIEQHENFRMLHLLYGACEDNRLAEAEDELYKAYEAFARHNQCAGIETTGRPGWKKILGRHGYTIKSCVYEKRFEGA